MSGSTPYTVKSNAAYDGTATPDPDVSIGSGVDVAVTALGPGGTTAALHTAMANFYSREALKGSDVTIINVGPEFGLISFYRDFSLSRFFSMWSVRSNTVSGTQQLRFMSKQDSRLCPLATRFPGCSRTATSPAVTSRRSIRRCSLHESTWPSGEPRTVGS